MSGLSAIGNKSGEVSLGFRQGWLKNFRLALSGAGGAAVAIAAFSLIERQPKEGFGVLAAWGPWPFVALLGLAIMGQFMSRMSDTIQTTFGAVVESVQEGAKAQSRQADALTKLAEQGGRQSEEVRRLAIYAAQEFPGVYGRLDQQDKVLEDIATHVKTLVVRGRERDD